MLVGHKNDLSIISFREGGQGIQISNLHGGGSVQNVRSFSHQFGGVDISLGGDDFTFGDSLSGGGRGKVLLEVLGEQNFLNEHSGDGDSPVVSGSLDNILDVRGHFFLSLEGFLEENVSEDVSDGRLGDFGDGHLVIFDGKIGLVRVFDVVIDDSVDRDVDVVLGHDGLFLQVDDSFSSVHQGDGFTARVDEVEAGGEGLEVLAELLDDAEVGLGDLSVWRLAAAADPGSEESAANSALDNAPLVARISLSSGVLFLESVVEVTVFLEVEALLGRFLIAEHRRLYF